MMKLIMLKHGHFLCSKNVCNVCLCNKPGKYKASLQLNVRRSSRKENEQYGGHHVAMFFSSFTYSCYLKFHPTKQFAVANNITPHT